MFPGMPAGDLAWYFPCVTFNQDGSSNLKATMNDTADHYLGWSCHTTKNGREAFYRFMKSSGDVYFTWDDVKNSSRRLAVYSGNVLDLDVLQWFNTSQVVVDPRIDALRTNPAVWGVDLTHAFQNGNQKQIGQCLSEIIRVGSIDTESVGCIASKVVLYVSLVFILSIVLVKFFLALSFQWFFSRRFAASKSSTGGDPKKRAEEIEHWSEDIYRPPPKLVDPAGGASKRGSMFLPTTSRFTSPYATERSMVKSRPQPTTMASQSSGSRLMAPSAGMYRHTDGSEGTLPSIDPPYRQSTGGGSRSSLLVPGSASDQRLSTSFSEVDGPGPQGFIHEAVRAATTTGMEALRLPPRAHHLSRDRLLGRRRGAAHNPRLHRHDRVSQQPQNHPRRLRRHDQRPRRNPHDARHLPRHDARLRHPARRGPPPFPTSPSPAAPSATTWPASTPASTITASIPSSRPPSSSACP